MSESLPITTPPRRHTDHHGLPYVFNNSSESCKNTPQTMRKLEPYHHALLDSGSQSAKSSPLPHRRLDKLEGVIRDKPSPLTMRRRLEADDLSSSGEPSPTAHRKYGANNQCSCNCSTQSRRNTTDSQQTAAHDGPASPMMRRRVESDCPRKTNNCCAKQQQRDQCGTGMCECASYSPTMHRKQNVYSSPAKSVLGEPGCFSSPIHRGGGGGVGDMTAGSFAKFGSPAKSVIGEPGVFASPARSLCISPCDESLEAEIPLQPDQTVVSGWLKFRDNKRVSFFDNFIVYITNGRMYTIAADK